MMFVTKHHRLGLRHVHLCDQRRPENGVQPPGRKDYQQNHTQNTRSGESIGPTVKDLWHSPLFPVTHEFSTPCAQFAGPVNHIWSPACAGDIAPWQRVTSETSVKTGARRKG